MPTVSAHVAHALSRHVDHVFGVMGNGNAYFLDALDGIEGIEFTAVRHEAGAVVAADAFFRASGRLAAASATYGAGFTNTLTALAEAVQARTPLVLIVGDEPTDGPRPWDVDQIALAAAVGARTYTAGRTDAAATTVIAIEHALSHSIPTVLAIPYDIAAREAGALTEPPLPEIPGPLAPRGAFAQGRISAIADALSSAERPLLLAGRGAWLAGAGASIDEIAELTGAVTASTALGRGTLPGGGARDIGIVGGFGAPGAMELVRRADVAVVFGASLNQFTMRFGALFAPGTTVFQVDVGSSATHPQVGGYVRGDAALVADDILRELRARRRAPTGWREGVDVAPLLRQANGQRVLPDGRLDPRSVAQRLGELLPEDRVVVSDGGHFIGWANMYWSVSSPERMLMVGTAYQAIGLGWPSVAGAALAQPESTVVLTTGDGGGLMALADLETALRVAAGRGMAVIWNDAAYGAELNVYGVAGLAREPMLIPEVDFAAVATGLGAEGVVVRHLHDLDRVISWAAEPREQRRFLVLDCRISRDVVAPYQQEIVAQRSH